MRRQIIRQSIERHIDSSVLISVGTVDGFQGQEFDIILLSLVRTQGVGFLSGVRFHATASRSTRFRREAP